MDNSLCQIPPDFHSGFVAVVGKANVGKSTLVNALTGTKTSITSPKPQTTRHRIMGIKNGEGYQIVFVDTPGVKTPEDELDKAMEKIYRTEARDADAILFVVDASKPLKEGDRKTRDILAKLNAFSRPLFLVLNKEDLVDPGVLAAHRKDYESLGAFTKIFEISALKRSGLKKMEKALVKLLPPGPIYFPDTMSTDQPPELMAAEIVREKILLKTRQEIPHGVFVHPEEIREGEKKGGVFISLFIYVEKENHKGIIIGKGGAMLKQIGTLARRELEAAWGKEVYLDIRVKVKENWKERKDLLKSWGYET